MINLLEYKHFDKFDLISCNEGRIDHLRNGTVFHIKWKYAHEDSIEYVIEDMEHLGSFFAHVNSLL